MSYILDALRKAEQERNLGKVPTLTANHYPPTAPRRWWPFWLTVLLLGNATVVTALVWRDNNSSTSTVTTAAVTAPPAAPAPVQLLPPDPAPPQDIATPAPSTAPVLATAATLPQNPYPPPPPSAIAPSQDSYQPPPLPETTSATAPEADLWDMPVEELAALSDTPLPEPLHALPAAFRQQLPEINLDVHVYSDVPERRFVIINGQRYREGDWINAGPLLEAIVPDGVIMHADERRFSLLIER